MELSKLVINNYMNSLFAEEQYKKCFAIKYLESCKIAKEIDGEKGDNTCDNIEWDSATRYNVAFLCREKINKMNIFQYPRFK